MDVKFSVVLNELGVEIISNLYETKSWIKTVMNFPKTHPSIFAGITDECNRIPFSPHSSLKDIPSSNFDPDTGAWDVCCMFKWKSPINEVIRNFLQHVIVEPSVMEIDHDLYEKTIIKNLTPINLEEGK